MDAVTYYFKDLLMSKKTNYILQHVSNRTLSNINHSHDFYEIFLILKGYAVHTMNDDTKKMFAGDCVILCPGDSHCFVSQSDDLELLGLSVSSDEFKTFASALCLDDLPNGKELCYHSIDTVFGGMNEVRICMDLCYTHHDWETNCKMLLCLLLGLYRQGIVRTEKIIPSALEIALRKINEPDNLKEGMSALIRLTHYSYPHLFRLMKTYFDQSPHTFILNARMETAYNKIVFSDTPICRIAEAVGYESVHYFSSIFQSHFGVSPSMLRKSTQNATIHL